QRSVVGQPSGRVLVDAGLALQRQREQPELRQKERRRGGREARDEDDAAARARHHRAAAPSSRGASRAIRRPAIHASVRLTASITTATAAARPASRSKNPRGYMKSEITSVPRAGPPPVKGMMRSNVLNDAMVI